VAPPGGIFRKSFKLLLLPYPLTDFIKFLMSKAELSTPTGV